MAEEAARGKQQREEQRFIVNMRQDGKIEKEQEQTNEPGCVLEQACRRAEWLLYHAAVDGANSNSYLSSHLSFC